MVRVRRLVTTVGLADTERRSVQEASVRALHEAELTDGSRVVLLADRGFTWSVHASRIGDGGTDAPRPGDVPGAWDAISVAELEEDARTVVGPDEAYGGMTQEQMAAGHWKTLAAVLAGHGVPVESERLAALPHDVELTDGVLARIAPPPA